MDCEEGEVIAAVGLAHNLVEIWQVPIAKTSFRNSDKIQQQVPMRLFQIVCDTRCITYCMAFYGWDENHGESVDSLSIAVGTVSNKILIWDVQVPNDLTVEKCSQKKVVSSIYSLEGHRGVIFCIRWIGGQKRICSSSDDRSVRLWKCSEENCEIYECIWIGWGHTARVWDVQWCMREGGKLVLISCGEDGSIRFWTPTGDDGNKKDSEKETTPYAIIPSHASSVWKIARNHIYPLLAAGGNDGSVKYWNIKSHLSDSCETKTMGGTIGTLQIPLDLRAFTSGNSNDNCVTDCDDPPKKRNKKAQQIICGVAIVHDSVVIATRAGSLFAYNFHERSWGTFSPWYHESHQHSKIVGECIAVHPSLKFLAIGCAGGEVFFSELGDNDVHCTTLTAASYCGVKSLHWIGDNDLLACHIKGIITWINLEKDSSTVSNQFPRRGTPMILRTLDMRSKGVPISFAYNECQKQLFVGDTRGNIAMFAKIEDASANVIECSAQVIGAHGREHVNCILPLSDSRLLSGGADGCLVEYHVECGNPSLIQKALSSSVQNFTSVIKIWSQRSNNGEMHTIIGGFYGNIFKVFDLTMQREISSAVCGGRNQRLLDAALAPFCITAFVGKGDSNGVNELHVHSSLLKQPTIAIEGEQNIDYFCFQNSIGLSFQGDTAYAVSIFHSLVPGRLFLLAGGNDCSTKLVKLAYSNEKLKVTRVKNLPIFESCSRATCYSTSPKSRCHLLASCGGKLSMCFYRLQDDHEAPQQDDMQCCFIGAAQQSKSADIDQRINAVDACYLNDTFHVVIAGDSDGGLHLLIVDDQKQYPKSIIPSKLLCSGIDKRPILCVQLLDISNNFIAVLGNTGGEVQVWNLGKVPAGSIAEYSPPSSPIHTYNPHTMGTNSISMVPLIHFGKSRQILIATGGDDQSLSLCCFQINLSTDSSEHDATQSILSNQRLIVMKGASTSSIKSVKLKMNGDDCFLYSIGYDQNLCVWKVPSNVYTEVNDGEDIAVSLVDERQIEISDVSCMDVVALHSGSSILKCVCAVVGQGLQIVNHS
uniref:Anaphase-promoting complex subunit 4 WD40 domain-containing protein n=1 Tax=Leptocylindrus danicus TaxID=163516 RepID=A0A7S2LPV2_9STRA